MSRRLSARDLSGWTVTGGTGSRGRAVPSLPGGGVDWSRPRCEPDNRPVVVLGRLLAVAVPLLAALPALWFGLPLSQRLGVQTADWLTAHGLSAWLLVAAPVGVLLMGCAVVGMVRPGTPARAVAERRVRVEVLPVTEPAAYPAGQLTYRVFDSPAMRPASGAAPVEPGPAAASMGRWSA